VDAVRDLLDFLERSPTPYHAVAESVRRLRACGFRPFTADAVWELEPGMRGLVVRNEGTLVAFEVGSLAPAEGGFRAIGAHTDSPNLRLKPRPDVVSQGYRQLAVEPYGGILLHTWLDRDLSLAGRVRLRRSGGLATELVDFARPLARIPNLAIHLQRELATKGLELNPAQHAPPLLGLEDGPALLDLLAGELSHRGPAVTPEDILAFDLMLYDTQRPALAGAREEFVSSARLDNLASCHAAVSALSRACDEGMAPFTRVVVLYDHEEVGSRSAEGAGGPVLVETLERIVSGSKSGAPQGLARALSRSILVSADMAHGVHPNYADRHDAGHRPVLGRGPVLKRNANQSYATDAFSEGLFASLCRRLGIAPQHFVARSDMPCGSTIGPISAARAGLRTVDVGNPMLAMHSCRETAGAADVAPMIDVLAAYLACEE
jgi:aspartyl aminopeptidase